MRRLRRQMLSVTHTRHLANSSSVRARGGEVALAILRWLQRAEPLGRKGTGMRRLRYLVLVLVMLIGVVPSQASAERTQALAPLAVNAGVTAFINRGHGGRPNGTCWVRGDVVAKLTRYPKWTPGTYSFSLRVMIKLQTHDSDGTVRTIRNREFWYRSSSLTPFDFIEANPIRNVPGRKYRTAVTVQFHRELQSGRHPVVWQRHDVSPWRRCVPYSCFQPPTSAPRSIRPKGCGD